MIYPAMFDPNLYLLTKLASNNAPQSGMVKSAVWSALAALIGTLVAAQFFVSSVTSAVGKFLLPHSESEAQLKRYWYTTYYQPPSTGELSKIVRQYVLDIQQKNLSNDLVSYMTDELSKVLDRELVESGTKGNTKKGQ